MTFSASMDANRAVVNSSTAPRLAFTQPANPASAPVAPERALVMTLMSSANCFAGVAAALRPGGLFFADMNTRHFLEHDWGVCEVLERPDFVQVTQSHFDSANACSTMVLTGFAGDDEHGYQRFDEVHIERAYTPEIVAGLLEAAGLRVEASYDCFTFQPASDRSQRIAWVARKPGDGG